MTTTIVIFNAFDRVCNESFIHGENFDQIHAALYEKCNTYEPLHILQSDDMEPVSLNNLNLLKK